MDLQDFKQWVRDMLGEGTCGVRVELDDKAIERSLKTAKEWYSIFCGLYRESTLALVSGQTEYDLTSISPGVDSVLKVWFPSAGYQLDYSVLYPGFLDIQGFPYGDMMTMGLGYPQTTIVQTMQSIESLERVLSADLDWEYVEDRMVDPVVKKLRVMPAPGRSGVAIIFYRVNPDEIKIQHYGSKDLYFVREYALALCKYKLGRVRGKYTSGLPAAGGDRQLDGESLISEAKEDMQRIEEKVLNSQGPVLPLVG